LFTEDRIMNITRSILTAALLLPLIAGAQSNPDADAKRLSEIKARHEHGQPVSDEDRQWAMQYMAAHGGQKGVQKKKKASGPTQADGEWAKSHPPRESTGLLPLADLGKGTYQGEQGGLYPGGGNAVPPAHLKAGLALARQIKPLDKDGHPSPGGKIVFLSIGYSNTTMEFQHFQKVAAADKELNPKLVIVDGAQGGQSAEVIADPTSHYWQVVATRLDSAGVTAQQVEAVWAKEALGHPTEGFPGAAKRIQAGVEGSMQTIHNKFPNVKIAYLSSRTYGGYATAPLSPEPYAYEVGFSVKWAIADQLAGKPELNYDAAKGPVRAPWMVWGPYLWTDGTKGRKTDSLVWLKDDCVETDRTHPSELGKQKVTKLLLDFLKTDPTSKSWFVGKM
jgi:hypothetical protein